MRFLIAGGLLSALLLGSATTQARAAVTKPVYHLAATFKLEGDGGWDYLSLDSSAHRLYIARGTRIQILDSISGAAMGQVDGVTGAHGVAIDEANHRAYASSGRSGTVLVFDTQTLQPVGTPIPVGDRPDAIVFEPVTKRVFAFNAGSNNVSIIDTATAKVVATTPLDGNPEFGAADGQGHMWANVESSSEIVEINAADGKIMGTYPLAPGQEPTGLAYDAKSGRLYSGCANKIMVVIDAKNGKQIAAPAIGEGVDATAVDTARGLAFSSNGRDGTISVIGLDDAAKPVVLNTIPTHMGARTMTIDSEGALYVVAADYEAPQPGAAAPAAGDRPRRPKMIPNSAVVMKFEPGAALTTAPTP